MTCEALFTRSEVQPDIFTVRKRICGKVMFSQACVKNSVYRGCLPDTPPPARHPPPRQTPLLGRHPQDTHTPQVNTPQTATAAYGTHPTGMHTCYFNPLPFATTLQLNPLYGRPTLHTTITKEIEHSKTTCKTNISDGTFIFSFVFSKLLQILTCSKKLFCSTHAKGSIFTHFLVVCAQSR